MHHDRLGLARHVFEREWRRAQKRKPPSDGPQLPSVAPRGPRPLSGAGAVRAE